MRSPGSWVVYDSVAPSTTSALTVPCAAAHAAFAELEHLALLVHGHAELLARVGQSSHQPSGIDPRPVR